MDNHKLGFLRIVVGIKESTKRLFNDFCCHDGIRKRWLSEKNYKWSTPKFRMRDSAEGFSDQDERIMDLDREHGFRIWINGLGSKGVLDGSWMDLMV